MNKTRNILPSVVREKAVALLNDTAADLPTDIVRTLDLQLWLLEAHINLQKNKN